MIELCKLSKTFAHHQALKNVDLFIQEGEIFGIIGQSGAGKSTLLRSINLLEVPDKGRVIVDGEDITQLKGKQLRQTRHKMAMIFQHFNLLNSKTVFENIALPMRIQHFQEPEINNKVKELLELVGLEEKANAYPSQLSGGQKQRVAIARALSCSPKILLCDEATSALDPQTTDNILALLKKINDIYGLTIVLITHEMEVVKRICHRLAVMEQGRIIELTSLSEAFKHEDSIAKQLLFSQLSPELPLSLTNKMVKNATDRPLIKLYFQGEEATVPFISQTSREMNIDINILLANIDRIDNVSCGILIVELKASPLELDEFTKRCQQAGITLEILGYVTNDVI